MDLPALRSRLRLPVIAAPMFTVSYPELVLAQCKAGIVGSFPALNARPAEQLDAWLLRLRTELDAHQAANPQAFVAPFAVNLIVNPGNDRLDQDLEACVRHRVPIVITSLRAPNHVVDAIHAYGGVHLHDVINLRHAMKALEAGVDGLVLVAAGAGGHAGTLNPLALVGEVRRHFAGPLALSGAITNGQGILAAEAMGADFAYIGTRFIATREAEASAAYQQGILDARAADVVYTSFFSGVHGNYLRQSIVAAGLDPDTLPPGDKAAMASQRLGSEGSRRHKTWKDIWGVGQGVGLIDDVPTVAELIERMAAEYQQARARLLAA